MIRWNLFGGFFDWEPVNARHQWLNTSESSVAKKNGVYNLHPNRYELENFTDEISNSKFSRTHWKITTKRTPDFGQADLNRAIASPNSPSTYVLNLNGLIKLWSVEVLSMIALVVLWRSMAKLFSKRLSDRIDYTQLELPSFCNWTQAARLMKIRSVELFLMSHSY